MGTLGIVSIALAGLGLGALVAWLVSQARHARLEEQLRQERQVASEKLQVLLDAEKKMSDQFEKLAGEALRASREDFLQVARLQFDGLHKEASQALEGKQKAFDELVKPIRESLGKVDEKLQTVEKERVGHYRQLTQHLAQVAEAHRELRSETASLSQALRAPTVRGRWGEIQLRRVVELAGMSDHCDFHEQRTFQSEDGALRPDLVVSLPGGASVVVDSKVPLEAYLAAAESTDPKEREARLADHARHVRDHVRTLSSKTYWKQFEDAPDFVVMFLPGEVFYSAALAEDPSLIEEAFQKGVLLASPTTLISILRAIHLGWNQERLAENARKISDEGRALYDRIKVLAEHFERLGKSLKSSVDHYNKAVGSLDQRVVVSARRMKELGAGGGDDPPTLAPVERLPRALQSPELSAPSESTDV
jgi:DNA recombination protein RmuC